MSDNNIIDDIDLITLTECALAGKSEEETSLHLRASRMAYFVNKPASEAINRVLEKLKANNGRK